MPLFVCKNCNCIENTALSNYWWKMHAKLCSECDPEIAKWHGSFPKEQFDPAKWDYEQDSDFIKEK